MGRETAVCRCVVTTVCLKELASRQMRGADVYKFVVRDIGTDVSVRSVASIALVYWCI